MKRHVILKCKNCGLQMFEGIYNEAEWKELKWMMQQTKYTACCGLFQHGIFPIQKIFESGIKTPISESAPQAPCVDLQSYQKSKVS